MNQLVVLSKEWIKEDCKYQNGILPDGTYGFWVWNDDKILKVGNSYGGAKVLKIIHQFEDLGEVQTLDCGWKGYVIFSRLPSLIINEDENV